MVFDPTTEWIYPQDTPPLRRSRRPNAGPTLADVSAAFRLEDLPKLDAALLHQPPAPRRPPRRPQGQSYTDGTQQFIPSAIVTASIQAYLVDTATPGWRRRARQEAYSTGRIVPQLEDVSVILGWVGQQADRVLPRRPQQPAAAVNSFNAQVIPDYLVQIHYAAPAADLPRRLRAPLPLDVTTSPQEYLGFVVLLGQQQTLARRLLRPLAGGATQPEAWPLADDMQTLATWRVDATALIRRPPRVLAPPPGEAPPLTQTVYIDRLLPLLDPAPPGRVARRSAPPAGDLPPLTQTVLVDLLLPLLDATARPLRGARRRRLRPTRLP